MGAGMAILALLRRKKAPATPVTETTAKSAPRRRTRKAAP